MNAVAAIDYDYDSEELLLKYQRDWIGDTRPLKIAEKSRRTGLTWAEAADASLTAAAKKSAGGTNHFYVGSNKEMAVEFIDAAAMWAKSFNKAASEIREEIFEDEDKDILTFNIYFSSGFKIQALSSRPSNLRGRQGNVTIDEAAFHDQLSEVLKASLALTMWGSKVRLISTHNGWDNQFNELIQDARSGKNDYSIHRVTLDDAVQQGLYKRICQVTGKEWSAEAEADWIAGLLRNTATREDALEEYYCVAKQGGGAYLSRALIESRMVTAPILRFEGTAEFNAMPENKRRAEIKDWIKEHLTPLLSVLNDKDRHVLGEDFGRSGDLTVLAPMAIKQQLQRHVPFMVELRNVPYKQQEQIVFTILDALPRFGGAAFDARGNGEYLAESATDKYGVNQIHSVKLSQPWYLENMPKLKSRFEDDEMQIPKDDDVLNDLRALQMVKGIPKLPDSKTNDKGQSQRHGDSAIALAMAEFAANNSGGPIEFTAAPSKSKRWDQPDMDEHQSDLVIPESKAW